MKKILLFITLKIIVFSSAQYTDDSDYNDFEVYNEFPVIQKSSINHFYDVPNRDDFYIIPGVSENVEKLINFPEQRVNLYKVSEKKYRYTKHRIPGYDYDEIDLVDDKNIQSCDERSTWTHCLCQFTCLEQNVVDCYTPCESGCECKEDFVFDEKTQQCVYPKDCRVFDNHII